MCRLNTGVENVVEVILFNKQRTDPYLFKSADQTQYTKCELTSNCSFQRVHDTDEYVMYKSINFFA